MDTIVAVAVEVSGGGHRYFLTWGRLFDAMDPTELEQVVLKFAGQYALGGRPIRAEVAYSLQDAAAEPYFFEAVHHFSGERIPASRKAYQKWQTRMRRELRQGKHLYYCGLPAQREVARPRFWSMK